MHTLIVHTRSLNFISFLWPWIYEKSLKKILNVFKYFVLPWNIRQCKYTCELNHKSHSSHNMNSKLYIHEYSFFKLLCLKTDGLGLFIRVKIHAVLILQSKKLHFRYRIKLKTCVFSSVTWIERQNFLKKKRDNLHYYVITCKERHSHFSLVCSFLYSFFYRLYCYLFFFNLAVWVSRSSFLIER